MSPGRVDAGLVRERLGIEPDEVPGGHCAYLSRPAELAAAVHRCWTEADAPPAASTGRRRRRGR